ncbi:hypothetical protein ABXN37_12605 [Piscinibacter sakaiensis]|uniref:Uncharacterized protein n=1 Tax=Piscinibacter sakaiensis TaxID=1547922 RepID=A0A0K8P025_PISS1|nr:hypothetical protein [Piscinibacter sakaiensis]GAP35986.1 hypothetical protein ISF6_1826 [Piscinibacter sakaiensis]
MPLTAETPLEQGLILQITPLKVARVYQIWGMDGSSIVLKWEIGMDKRFMKEGSELIGQIDSLAKPVPLRGGERHELMRWCKDKMEWISRARRLQNSPNHDKRLYDAAQQVEILANDPKQHGFKLRLLRVSALDEAIQAFDERGESKPLRSIAKVLLAHDGLEQLGRVVALDLVLGNMDRFDPQLRKPNQVKLGSKTLSLKAVANVANLMIVTGGERWSITALDSFDNFSKWNKDTGKAFSSLSNAIEVSPLTFLVQNSLRERYAENIIDDLQALFAPSKRSLFPLFGRKERDRLLWGMIDGGIQTRERLKTYIRGRVQNKGATIHDRWAETLELLGKLHH